MSETFVASNGAVVDLNMHGEIGFNGKGVRMDDQEVDALREFFQHERDEELGRWRDPANSDFVVYPMNRLVGGMRTVQVVSERHGYGSQVNEGEPKNMEIRVAAASYFAAHPESKPWHDAVDGQLWLIRFNDFPDDDVAALVKEGRFQYNDHCCEGGAELTDPTLVSATRVWPEVSDAE